MRAQYGFVSEGQKYSEEAQQTAWKNTQKQKLKNTLNNYSTSMEEKRYHLGRIPTDKCVNNKQKFYHWKIDCAIGEIH